MVKFTTTVGAQLQTIEELKREMAAVKAHNSERCQELRSLDHSYDRTISFLWLGIMNGIPSSIQGLFCAMMDEAVRLEDRLLELDPSLRDRMENKEWPVWVFP